MAKTASGLVEFAKDKLGTPYVYGAKCQVVTMAQFNLWRKMYPNMIPASDVKKVGKFCTDCSGLISGYTGIILGSSQFKSTATKCIPISRISEAVPGCALWRSGHIGVYIGNGLCIEAKGSAYGTVQSVVANRTFTHILWLRDIDYSDATTVPNVDTVTVTANLNLRKEPNANSTSLGIMSKNSKIEFVSDNGNGWSKVKWNGKTGYASNKYLSGKNLSYVPSTPTTSPSTTVKVTTDVNFRSEPNAASNSSSIRILKKNEKVTFVKDTGWGWSEVKHNGKTGYISNAYLSKSGLSGKKTKKNASSGNVNIRSSASTSSSIVGKIKKAASFQVSGIKYVGSKIWMRTTVNGVSGWVYYDSSYIK